MHNMDILYLKISLVHVLQFKGLTTTKSEAQESSCNMDWHATYLRGSSPNSFVPKTYIKHLDSSEARRCKLSSPCKSSCTTQGFGGHNQLGIFLKKKF